MTKIYINGHEVTPMSFFSIDNPTLPVTKVSEANPLAAVANVLQNEENDPTS